MFFFIHSPGIGERNWNKQLLISILLEIYKNPIWQYKGEQVQGS